MSKSSMPSSGSGGVVLVALGSFAATNLDDLMILTVSFASSISSPTRVSSIASSASSAPSSASLQPIHVIIGQYLGFSFIVAVSLLGYMVGSFVQPKYIGLLGIIPFYIGLHKYLQMCICPEKDDDDDYNNNNDAQVTGPAVDTNSAIGNGGINGDNNNHNNTTSEEVVVKEGALQRLSSFCLEGCHPGVVKVVSMTVANGADNISIYVPLFGASLGWKIAIILAIYYFLIGVWCAASYALVSVPAVTKAITKYGHYIVPGLLMGLGFYILWNNECYTIFEKVR